MIYESPKDDSLFSSFFWLPPWKVYGNSLLHVQSLSGDSKCTVGFSLYYYFMMLFLGLWEVFLRL